MVSEIIFLTGPCRHEKYGRCSNHFWTVMKTSGKPGLRDYYCRLWQAKLAALEEYHEAAWRAGRFGLIGDHRQEAMKKFLKGRGQPKISCPEFRPAPQSNSGQSVDCRYFFLETCLLTFPRCPGHCDDFLPVGDQT